MIEHLKIFQSKSILQLWHHNWRSWTYVQNSFLDCFQKFTLPLPENDHCRLINESSGKYVWRIQQDGFDIAFKLDSGKAPWRYFLKHSLVMREYRNYRLFASLGIPVPQVLAVGELRKCTILRKSFIVTAFVPDTFDGRSYMPGGTFQNRTVERIAFAKQNLLWLGKVHQQNIFHKAFHPRNILCRRKDDGKIQYFWIDLARCQKMFAFRINRAVVQDLHHFFNDMQFTQEQTHELVQFYCQHTNRAYEPVWHGITHFRRHLIKKKKYSLFADG